MLQFLGLRGVRHDLVREQEQQFASEPTIFLAKLVIGVLDLFLVVHGPEVTPMLTHIEAQEWAPFKIPGWALGPGVFPPDPCPCWWCNGLASPPGGEQTERTHDSHSLGSLALWQLRGLLHTHGRPAFLSRASREPLAGRRPRDQPRPRPVHLLEQRPSYRTGSGDSSPPIGHRPLTPAGPRSAHPPRSRAGSASTPREVPPFPDK